MYICILDAKHQLFRDSWQSSSNVQVIHGDSCNVVPIPWLLPYMISDYWLTWLRWSTIGTCFMATLLSSPAWHVVLVFLCSCASTQPTSWSVFLLLMVLSINFTILVMLFLGSHRRRGHFIAGELLVLSPLHCLTALLVIASLEVVTSCSLNLALVTALYNMIYWMYGIFLLAVLLFRKPILSHSRHLSKNSQIFIRSSSSWWLSQYEMIYWTW